jgi:hypothetical protein
MPRYFFHIRCGDELESDEIGVDLPNDEAAVNEGRIVAGELLRDAGMARKVPHDTVEVMDGEGRMVLRFKCSDVEIKGL